MAGPEFKFGRCGALVVLVLVVTACAGGKAKPTSLPGQTTSPEPQASQEESPTAPAVAAEPEVASPEPDEASASAVGSDSETEQDDSIVMIDPGQAEEGGRTVSLVEAAQAEQERRRTAPPAQVVITNRNLEDFATGQLTVSQPSATATTGEDSTGASSQAVGSAQDEAFWRSRAREIRESWKAAAERVEELEQKVFELRQAFYAEDDGFYRDSQIKPAWDRAIEQLAATRQQIEDRQQELEEFLETGRQAGALPGWLREGIELEPTEEEPSENVHEPSEPVIYEPDGAIDPT